MGQLRVALRAGADACRILDDREMASRLDQARLDTDGWQLVTDTAVAHMSALLVSVRDLLEVLIEEGHHPDHPEKKGCRTCSALAQIKHRQQRLEEAT